MDILPINSLSEPFDNSTIVVSNTYESSSNLKEENGQQKYSPNQEHLYSEITTELNEDQFLLNRFESENIVDLFA